MVEIHAIFVGILIGMVFRSYCFIILITLFLGLSAYGQTSAPGCNSSYYRGTYTSQLPLMSDVDIWSQVVGPDGSLYLGVMNYPEYSVAKLDTAGNVLWNKSYDTVFLKYSGKTIMDIDGNLITLLSESNIIKTDTAGNIFASRKLALSTITGRYGTYVPDSYIGDVVVLANGDKVFLIWTNGAAQLFLVETSPDLATIRWTKVYSQWSDIQTKPAIMADGNNLVFATGFGLAGSGLQNRTVLMVLDGNTGATLQERWFGQLIYFQNLSRFNNGYLFAGAATSKDEMNFLNYDSLIYIRTDLSLNVLAANYFPSLSLDYVQGYPFLVKAQADGSAYGIYSSLDTMTLFQISPNDVIEWANSLPNTSSGFYQHARFLTLAPSAIYITTQEWSSATTAANIVLSPGFMLYKTSYSGSFPSCTKPGPGHMSMTPYPLFPVSPYIELTDTTAFTDSNYALQVVTAPAIIGNTCTSMLPSCDSLKVTGSPNVCDSGRFSGTTNLGCSLPVTWTVIGGPDTAIIHPENNNVVSISFPKSGAYMVKAIVNSNCITEDSMMVNVLTDKQCLTGFHMPNAFTPNGDGKNDIIRPLISGDVARYRFTVYNRWGELLFESSELLKGWDGTFLHTPQPAGGFVWYCQYQLQGQALQTQKGTFVLIR
ncbi:MAG: hypothetical protein C5B59_18485 [Bacteroidetes bacterium]|nr:MAG: hypothetical protein C5B59_18485 [Bacteroidota bacterium]